MRVGHEQENRWDYLLGHRPSGEIVAVEPHAAKQDEISTIVGKLTAAKRYIRPHLRDGVTVKRWLWVASGNVQFYGEDHAASCAERDPVRRTEGPGETPRGRSGRSSGTPAEEAAALSIRDRAHGSSITPAI